MEPVKMPQLAEMSKLTYLITEGTTFIKDWEFFLDFLLKMAKNELVISEFTD